MVAIDKRDSVSHEKDTVAILPAEQVVSHDMYDSDSPYGGQSPMDEGPAKRKLGEGKWWRIIVTPGSPAQIVLAALVAIGIGMGVNVAVDTVPEAAVALLAIPGQLWLRALSAVGEYRQVIIHL
jgi:hypothetical protein